MSLKSQLLMNLDVLLAEPVHIGNTGGGNLAIIPIIGGTFKGPKLSGAICSGGADWNRAISPEISHVFARYWLKTQDGIYISIENEGFLDNTKPDAIIKTTPRFQCDINGPYGYLCTGIYVGELVGGSANSVNIRIHEMK